MRVALAVNKQMMQHSPANGSNWIRMWFLLFVRAHTLADEWAKHNDIAWLITTYFTNGCYSGFSSSSVLHFIWFRYYAGLYMYPLKELCESENAQNVCQHNAGRAKRAKDKARASEARNKCEAIWKEIGKRSRLMVKLLLRTLDVVQIMLLNFIPSHPSLRQTKSLGAPRPENNLLPNFVA